MLMGDLINPEGTSIRFASSRYVPLARRGAPLKTFAPHIKLLSINPFSLGIKLMFGCISLETHPKVIHVWPQLPYFNNSILLIIDIYHLIIMCVIRIIFSIFHQISIYIFWWIFVSISRQTSFIPLLDSLSSTGMPNILAISVSTINWCSDQISRVI